MARRAVGYQKAMSLVRELLCLTRTCSSSGSYDKEINVTVSKAVGGSTGKLEGSETEGDVGGGYGKVGAGSGSGRAVKSPDVWRDPHKPILPVHGSKRLNEAMLRLEIGAIFKLEAGGVLNLKNQHTVYRVLAALIVIWQIIVAVASLNIRPVGVGPTTWTTPDIGYFCDRPNVDAAVKMPGVENGTVAPMEAAIRASIRQNRLKCSAEVANTNSSAETVMDVVSKLVELGEFFSYDERLCCSIIMSSETPRLGLVDPEPEPMQNGELLHCPLSKGYQNESEPEPEPSTGGDITRATAEPEPEPEPEPGWG